ncbi:MAG: hypothetical protein HC783_12200 [Rhodobacteraceae bacterium]|nr:hypothetical protein [Paracoccaceae bacterium]
MVGQSGFYATILILLAAAPLAADSPREVLFPSDAVCYARAYSAQHLADHPVQRVSPIALRPEGAKVEDPAMLVWVTISFRDRPDEALEALAYCQVQDSTRLGCIMEGDAGAFTIAAGKKGSALVSVEKAGMAFETATGFVTLRADAGDDRSFLLQPGPCP